MLTVTGAVGLLLGSLAWALTGQFMAAPLVFAASLTTALALAVALEDQAGAAEATAVDLAERLRQAQAELERLGRTAVRPEDGPRDLELNGLLDRCVAAARPAAIARGVMLRAEPSELYLAIHADANLLERAIDSLLAHAIAVSPAGSTVQALGKLAGDRAVAEVRDAGPGRPDVNLPDAFGRFRTVETDSGCAEAWRDPSSLGPMPHDGVLSVHRVAGRGSRFTLSLPFGHRSSRSAASPGVQPEQVTPTVPKHRSVVASSAAQRVPVAA